MHTYVCVYIYIYAFIFWVVLKEGIKKNLRSQQKYWRDNMKDKYAHF